MLGADRCPSLVDQWGFFYPTEEDLYARGNPDEIRAEAEAQIRRAHDWGLDATNLDGHMGTLYKHPPYLTVYLELARRHHLPLRLPPRRMYEEEGAATLYDALSLEGLFTNDDVRFIHLDNPPALRHQLFETLRTLQPGITELCLHAAVPTPEAQAVMSDWPARVEALSLVTDDSIRREIERLGIVLIGWRAMRDALRQTA